MRERGRGSSSDGEASLSTGKKAGLAVTLSLFVVIAFGPGMVGALLDATGLESEAASVAEPGAQHSVLFVGGSFPDLLATDTQTPEPTQTSEPTQSPETTQSPQPTESPGPTETLTDSTESPTPTPTPTEHSDNTETRSPTDTASDSDPTDTESGNGEETDTDTESESPTPTAADTATPTETPTETESGGSGGGGGGGSGGSGDGAFGDDTDSPTDSPTDTRTAQESFSGEGSDDTAAAASTDTVGGDEVVTQDQDASGEAIDTPVVTTTGSGSGLGGLLLPLLGSLVVVALGGSLAFLRSRGYF